MLVVAQTQGASSSSYSSLLWAWWASKGLEVALEVGVGSRWCSTLAAETSPALLFKTTACWAVCAPEANMFCLVACEFGSAAGLEGVWGMPVWLPLVCAMKAANCWACWKPCPLTGVLSKCIWTSFGIAGLYCGWLYFAIRPNVGVGRVR